ncbi:hypothetical protein TDB9533_02858 [Thalassocella blandensis]|nr:hypothetical protein TDB9533_02858 [Thalassocella blandensis]
MNQKLLSLVDELAKCRLCEKNLPLEPRPIFQLYSAAKILIAGQAPGKQAHFADRPFADASGKRLREWMGVSESDFYTPENFAILPMGMCFPGKAPTGDLPPLKRCSQTWHAAILSRLEQVKFRIVIGRHAQAYYLPDASGSLADIIQRQLELDSSILVLPHPSPRNNIWLAKNSWFERDVLPLLRRRVSQSLSV